MLFATLEFTDFAIIAMIVAIFSGGRVASAAYKAWSYEGSGVLVRIDPSSFLGIVQQQQGPLVVYATYRRFFFTRHQHRYLTSYKGLMFVAEADAPPGSAGRDRSGAFSAVGQKVRTKGRGQKG